MEINHRRVKGTKNLLPWRINLAAWYRYKIGLTNINGACSQWMDSSNQGRHLLQATAASRPRINSDASLTFDGVDDMMSATFTLAQPCSIYIAFQQLTWTLNDTVFDGKTALCALFQSATTPGLVANAGSSLTASTTIGLNTGGVACFVANGASSIYQAGGGAATVTTSGNAGANAPGGFTLGSTRTPLSFSNITVKEVIIYSVAHDATQRLQILRYLGRVAQVGGVM